MMWILLGDLLIAISFFTLGAYLWPKITGEEERLAAEMRSLREQLEARWRKP